MTLEDYCISFFDGLIKPKDLVWFDETTPNGNQIKGYLNQKPNKYLGSVLITMVNGEECLQFVQSMLKIHYFNHSKDISKDTINYCFEKLDGSCLILYPLKNHTGEIIEIVPKTRGRAVADNHFIELYDKIDKKPIINYYDENDGILIFEMYGILNQHDIIHYATGVDVALISIVEDGLFYNYPIDFDTFAFTKVGEYGFKLPDLMFELYHNGTYWYIREVSQKYRPYLKGIWEHYPTIEEAVDGLKTILENLNKDYSEINSRIATEGVVINTIREDGSKKFIKVKPHSIQLKHQSENGIPSPIIRKEVHKYFDEYGSTVEEIYKEDSKHHTEYLHRMLLEEYPIEYVQKSKNKIERIFLQEWDKKQVPQSIHTICDDLINDYPNSQVSDLMRIFAEKYPMKKKDARLVYHVLEKKIGSV